MPTQQRWTYRGCSFQLWNNQQAWFWMRADCNSIGAAPSESDALAEAYAAIDQFLGPCHGLGQAAHLQFDPKAADEP
jgi:hypothetical protein